MQPPPGKDLKPTRAEAEEAVRTLIRWAGDDPGREGLLDTPGRVVRAYEEWFSGYAEDPRDYLQRTFEEVGGYDEIVLLRDIRFESHCEHHMAPISGKAHIGYLPRNRVVGISKLARLVDVYRQAPAGAGEDDGGNRRLRRQRCSSRTASAWWSRRAHQCMTTRGVHKHGVSMVTSRMLGAFRTNPATRQEFLFGLGL